jgi:hypothetical protein
MVNEYVKTLSVQPIDRPDVDDKSYELAEHFLQDEKAADDDKWNLAWAIQSAVEDWFDSRSNVDSVAAMGAELEE